MKLLRNVATFTIGAVNAGFTAVFLLTAYSPYIQPVAHPLHSCLGLAFPIFLMANICFLFFWLIIRHYKVALLPLAGILLAYPQIRTYIPVNFHTGHLPEGSLKILSYNIMGFDGCIKKDGKNPILFYLQESGADILCLQEYATSNSKQYLTQEDIDCALKDYPYHRIDKLGNPQANANRIACYSKYPILSARKLDYKSNNNGSVVYELKIGKDTLTLINNHLESNKLTKEDKVVYEDMLESPQRDKVESGARLLLEKLAEASALRAPQADAIAQAAEQSKHPTVIVCGDFNDTPISYTHRVACQGLNDAFTQSGRGLGISYNQNKFYFRIDHILTSKNLQTYNCTVDKSIKDSDHYPIWCHFTFKEK